MEPGEGSFDDPAFAAKPRSVLCSPFGDDGSDAAGAERLSVRLRVVAAISEERVGSVAWSSALASHGWDGLDEWQQLSDVVPVGASEQAGERDAVGVGDQVVLAARSATVDGARAGLVAPKSAHSEAESQTVRERSSRSV
jgi:hypothetical protein